MFLIDWVFLFGVDFLLGWVIKVSILLSCCFKFKFIGELLDIV